MVARQLAGTRRRRSPSGPDRALAGTYADSRHPRRAGSSRCLTQLGIRPGEAVAFQLPNWREAVVSFAALALGGYVLVPIVHIYGRKEVAFILEESGAAAYISPIAYGHVDYAQIVEAAAPASLRLHVVVAATELRPGPAGITRVAWEACAERNPAIDLPSVRSDDVAMLAYTSGTTGDPKGVIHDHRTMLAELSHMAPYMNPGKPNLMGSPVTHATGMLGAVLGPLVTGENMHVIDRWDPGHALEVMRKEGIGGGTGASVFLASLLDHPDFTPEHAATMERVGLGGAPVSVALGERAAALGIAIIRAYGSTEHPSTTGGQFDDLPARRHGTDGRALAGVELRIVDEDGADVPRGTPGEILSRGPDLCLGYTDPALNAAAFDDEGWYRSGDIGVLDDDGYLTITDRLKDVIIRGGENISAAEVETALQKLPGVAEIAVVAAPDERLGEHACAIIRMLPGAAPVEPRRRDRAPRPHWTRPPEVARGASPRRRLPPHRSRQDPQGRSARLAPRGTRRRRHGESSQARVMGCYPRFSLNRSFRARATIRRPAGIRANRRLNPQRTQIWPQIRSRDHLRSKDPKSARRAKILVRVAVIPFALSPSKGDPTKPAGFQLHPSTGSGRTGIGSAARAPGERVSAPQRGLRANGYRLRSAGSGRTGIGSAARAPGERVSAPQRGLRANGYRLRSAGSGRTGIGSAARAPGERVSAPQRGLRANGYRLRSAGSGRTGIGSAARAPGERVSAPQRGLRFGSGHRPGWGHLRPLRMGFLADRQRPKFIDWEMMAKPSVAARRLPTAA